MSQGAEQERMLTEASPSLMAQFGGAIRQENGDRYEQRMMSTGLRHEGKKESV